MPQSVPASVRRKAVAEAQALISAYGLDLNDLLEVEQELLKERSKAREIAVHQARQIMEFWGLTARDLSGSVRRAPTSETVKYAHPVTGETWSGFGPQPDWLRKALLTEGYRVEEVTPGTPGYLEAVNKASAVTA